MCFFNVLYVFVVSAPFFGLHLFFSFLPSFFFFACSVLYDCSCTIFYPFVHVKLTVFVFIDIEYG